MEEALFGFTVVQLRAMLKHESLTTTGLKAVLVQRLGEHYLAHPETCPPELRAHCSAQLDAADDPQSTSTVPSESPAKATAKGKPKAATRKTASAATKTTVRTRGGGSEKISSARASSSRKKKASDEDEEEDQLSDSLGESDDSLEDILEDMEKTHLAGKPRSAAQISRWIKFDSLLLYSSQDDIMPSTSVYGFDMDDTLIETKSGRTFATSRIDWKWIDKCVPEVLQKLAASGKKVVIFTNQAGINSMHGHDPSKEAMITGKIEDIISTLNIPIQVLIATADDVYRKPGTALWNVFIEKLNGGVTPNPDESAFVGDAAGRPAGWATGKKQDFSCSDRKFAFNLGIKFFTPEMFFFGQQDVPFDWGSVNISGIPEYGPIIDGDESTITSAQPEMIVFVGFPASGKSTFAKTHLVPHNYVHINRDTLQTQEKCVAGATEALRSGSSVVIDNTNPSQAIRSAYIKIAQQFGVPVRCFRFDVEEDLAMHLNHYREQITQGSSAHVPRIGYAMYKKQFEEPVLSEGFSEVRHVRFVAKFDTPEQRKMFMFMH